MNLSYTICLEVDGMCLAERLLLFGEQLGYLRNAFVLL